VHVCTNRNAFVSYQASDGSVTMGNATVARVRGSGRVELKLTSGKVLQLHGVQHVPELRKNLISGSRLVQDGHKLVFESNKIVVSKFGSFIGLGYMSEGLFKLSILPEICSNKIDSSVILNVENSDVWHARLGHVNSSTLKRMMNFDLIPNSSIDYKHKCQICVQAKQPRKSFHNVDRDSYLLELIHSDLCEFNGVLTRGGKRYFISFIDDNSKFCYVYLIKTKDEALDRFTAYKAEVENQLERKIKILRSDRGASILPIACPNFVSNMELSLRSLLLSLLSQMG